MDMNLFDKIILAATHPVTRQWGSEILLWAHGFTEGGGMPRLSLKYSCENQVYDDFSPITLTQVLNSHSCTVCPP